MSEPTREEMVAAVERYMARYWDCPICGGCGTIYGIPSPAHTERCGKCEGSGRILNPRLVQLNADAAKAGLIFDKYRLGNF